MFWLILYESPMIFIYDLDFGRWGLSIKSESTFCIFLRYFSIVNKLRSFAGLLIVMIILLFVLQIKSVIMSDLEFFQTFVDVSNVNVSWVDDQLSNMFSHWYDDFLPQWPSSCHVDPGFLVTLSVIFYF